VSFRGQYQSSSSQVSAGSSASVAYATARRVSLARGGRKSCCSLNEPTEQAGSEQRQIRLRQGTRTGVPKHGASPASCTRRPCPTATTPQPGQPTGPAA
jgi:hypothetical protein